MTLQERIESTLGKMGFKPTAAKDQPAAIDLPKPLEQMANDHATLKTTVKQLQTQIEELQGTVEEQAAELKQNTIDLKAKEAEIERLNTEAKTKAEEHAKALEAKEGELGQRANTAAREKLRAMGVPALAEEAAEGSDADQTEAQLWAQYNKLTDPKAQRAFYTKHREVMGA